MSFTGKPLELLEESDLRTLLDNEIPEGKTIDYKEALSGNSDKDKKEFLYDVSSFANTLGGHHPRENSNGSHHIRGIHNEQKIVERILEYISVLNKLSAEPPFFIMPSLLNVKGYSMFVSSDFQCERGHSIDRHNLLMPEVIIENFNFEPSKVMKPIFDTVWNACGYSGSLNFDDSGNWLR